MQALFVAMSLYPRVQQKAQAELDAVVGPHRLPEHADRAALPYVAALAKEALRWQNVLPLGVVHRCADDDAYRGWSVPRGTLVVANIWCVTMTCDRPCFFLFGVILSEN